MAEETLVLGGGCFWCTEAMFNELRGVIRAESGYAGGQTKNPTYQQVCSGTTGHAEVIKITFDPEQISSDDLVAIHMATHDPTTLNQQGGDFGTQYRSCLFYQTEEERARFKEILDDLSAQNIWPNPIVTTIEPLGDYYPAEDYHQNYLKKFESAGPLQKMGMNAGYCSGVVAPKVAKFRKQYFDRLKS